MSASRNRRAKKSSANPPLKPSKSARSTPSSPFERSVSNGSADFNDPATSANADGSADFNDPATSANADGSTDFNDPATSTKSVGARKTRAAISTLPLDRETAIREADARRARFVAAVAALVSVVAALATFFDGDAKRRFDSPPDAPSSPNAAFDPTPLALADAVAAEVEKATLAAARRREIVETSVRTAAEADDSNDKTAFNGSQLADSNDKTDSNADVRRPDAETLVFVVELNSASKAELTNLPRVGEKLAERIIERREELGGFRKVDDLLGVKGIGEKTLDKMRPFCVVAPPDSAE